MSQTQADPLQLKAQLLAEIAALPSDRMGKVLDFVRSLHTDSSIPSAQAFLSHLKTIGTWSGNDLQDCLEAVQNSRGEAHFDSEPNPFES